MLEYDSYEDEDEDEDWYEEWDDEDDENIEWDDDDDDWEDEVVEQKQTTKKENTMIQTTKTFIPHILSGDSISVFHKGVHPFPSSHIFYKDICNAVKNGDVNKLESLLGKKTCIAGLEIRDDEVLWNGELLHGTAVTRLFEAKKAGFDINPIIKFLENCQKNPFPKVVEKLYDFLETRAMPITEDGCFLGFKYTNEDYWDSHTGKTYRFLPYTTVKATNIENRGTVCDLSGEECSGQGIHVGNFQYSGSQPTVVYVKVNPSNVLSCPHGSAAKKIRVWELDVLGRADGKPFEELIVDKNGDKIPYIKGNSLRCKYKAEYGETELDGEILNVGEKYIELDAGYSEYIKGKTLNFSTKRRLKISNIIEVL